MKTLRKINNDTFNSICVLYSYYVFVYLNNLCNDFSADCVSVCVCRVIYLSISFVSRFLVLVSMREGPIRNNKDEEHMRSKRNINGIKVNRKIPKQ